MHNVEGVLVRGADQTNGVKSPSNQRVVQLDAILSRRLSQFAALQYGQQARPVPRTAIKHVMPPRAHLGQGASFQGREVEKE